MFPYLANLLTSVWGPFRLFGSRLVQMAFGTFLCALLVWRLLPRLWDYLPHDRGKILVANSDKSKGKPTGAGLLFVSITLLCVLMVIPFTIGVLGLLVCLFLMMITGFLDDRSHGGWPESIKMICDVLVAVVTAFILFCETDGLVWLPFIKSAAPDGAWHLAAYYYVPVATLLLLVSVNVVNCSDGVDGVAGSLSLLGLAGLAVVLYVVFGHQFISQYLLVPHCSKGATWATIVFTASGGLGAYLWYNASPSQVMMGDAGSRFFGLLIGIAVMATGNPFMLFVFAPILFLNGGCGLVKLLILRGLKCCGVDTRMPLRNAVNPIHPENFASDEEADRQVWIVRFLHHYRFPVHDHCRRRLNWSDPQVLVRFMLLQAALMPILAIIVIKLR